MTERRLVAIAVPIYRSELTADEETSLGQLRRVLGAYDTFVVAPEGLAVDLGLPVRRFPKRFFRGRRGWSELVVSRRLHEAFADYEFLLIHQLDALVFRDELAAWCARGYDYVGAPWARFDADGRATIHGVGNGGLSLRRIDACLAVLDADRSLARRLRFAGRLARRLPVRTAVAARTLARTRRPAGLRVRAATALDQTVVAAKPFAGDKFWALEAPRLVPGFRIAPVDEAVRFSIDQHPSFWLERTGGELPFGCHGWPKNERELWERHLET